LGRGVDDLNFAGAIGGQPGCLVRFVRSPDAAVITVSRLQRPDGVVREHPLLRDQAGGQSVGILEERAVRADAEPQNEVQFRPGVVQQFGLRYGVAHGLVTAGLDLFNIGQANGVLRHAAMFARDGRHREPVAFHDAAQRVGEVDEADAGRYANFSVAKFLGEFTNPRHPCPSVISFRSNFG
jgi:hypothetical protein